MDGILLLDLLNPDGMLSQSFMDILKNSESGTTWTNNNNGTFTSNNGETVSDGESTENAEQSNSSNGGTPDPPTTSSFWDLMKSIFRMSPRSNEEAHQMEVDRNFFFDSTNFMIEVGDNYLTAMTAIFPLPSNPTSEVKATGWIARKVFSRLDPAIAKKFASAMGKGVVAPTGKQGIIRLTASEAEAVGAGYTHKLKILGKGGDLRIYGKQLPNGQFLFDKLLTH
ncbi:hypothetical protein [Flavobacterium sp.]|uniref:hypothetical protein n=1 Tax=Flavobacterium sp. TaxID=239 RepID=UPI0031CF2792